MVNQILMALPHVHTARTIEPLPQHQSDPVLIGRFRSHDSAASGARRTSLRQPLLQAPI
jgi:hypothetical protein